MRKLILVFVLCAQMSAQSKAPTGEIPLKGKQQIDAALAAAKIAQADAMKAQNAASVSSQQVNFVLNLVKSDMELDATWEFNPAYFDTKSPDYHMLKFIKKPDPPPAPARAAQPPPSPSQGPPK